MKMLQSFSIECSHSFQGNNIKFTASVKASDKCHAM
jgi:hypothetical protein